jgi:hypothetical protein
MPSMLDGDDVPVDSGSRRSRRSLLRAGVLGGGAALLTATGADAASSASASAAASPSSAEPASRLPMQNLFTLSDLDFETLFAFGSAGYGCAEFGELVTAVNGINAAGASYQAYYETFLALAKRISKLADDELAAGHTAAARSAYLRACTYYDLCLYFILGTTAAAQEQSAYADVQRCWQAASQLFDTPFEQVRIPYGNSWLPAETRRPAGAPPHDHPQQRRGRAEHHAVLLRRGRCHRARLQRPDLRRARPGLDAVRAAGPVPV